MTSTGLREKFREFFRKRGHTIVPSSSLVPDDPSVLLTTAGMQQFKPYYTGQADPFVSPHPTLEGKPLGAKNAASIQKSFRTSDIDEVGDERHLTFFEMMGNFSFGGYFKQEAIQFAKEFLDSISVPIEYVTVFRGDQSVPKDEESRKIWEGLGVKDIREEGREDNFWGPTGKEGPCGPTTEIYAAGIEIWNLVFNEYYQHQDKTLEKLQTPGVDTGMGLERLALVSQSKKNVFETDLFSSIIEHVPSDDASIKRVLADHLRASAHLIADGIESSNKDRGYILRRLLRRAIFHIVRIANEPTRLRLDADNPQKEVSERVMEIIQPITNAIAKVSPYLEEKHIALIDSVVKKEIGTSIDLLRSTSELRKAIEQCLQNDEKVFPADVAFKFFSSYGVPPDFIRDEVRKFGLGFNEENFESKRKKHQEISRAGQERKFGGHGLLLDTGELKAANEEELKIVTRLHTATHLLQAGLRKVLGESVHQAGSDITAERLRFDFTFDRKLAPEEIKQIENWVNQVVQKDVPMGYQEMPYGEAIKTGSLYFAKEKYPPMVKVYSAADPATGEVYTKELCGGPHVTHTGEVGRFKILKEEAVGAGVRRLRAVVEEY